MSTSDLVNSKLYDILNKNSIRENKPDNDFFELMTVPNKIYWKIKSAKGNNFWYDLSQLIYEECENISSNEEIHKMILAEPCARYMPVIGMFTFKFDYSNDIDLEEWSPFCSEFLPALVYIYQEILTDHFRIEKSEFLSAIVLETPVYFLDKSGKQPIIVVEIRIQFPFIKVEVIHQKDLIRENVIRQCRMKSINQLMLQQPIGDWSDFLYKEYKSIPLYGNSLKIGAAPPVFKHFWPSLLENSAFNINNNYSINQLFFFLQHGNISDGTIDYNMVSSLGNEDEKKLLPLFLSLRYNVVNTELKNETILDENSPNVFNEENTGTPWEISLKMLSLLSIDRYKFPGYWLDIGRALYHSTEGSSEGLKIWIDETEKNTMTFGKLPSFITEIENTIGAACSTLYERFYNDHVSFKTLCWYAREDNPIEYNNWHKAFCISAIQQALDDPEDHYFVSNAIVRVYMLEHIVYAYSTGMKWYHYRNHRWVEDPYGSDLNSKITSDFRGRLYGILSEISNDMKIDTPNKKNASEKEETVTRITKLTRSLGKVNFVSNILRAIRHHPFIYMTNFGELLNTNNNITGLLNGVFEVYGKSIFFRDGKPEDYISLRTSTSFKPELSMNSPEVQRLLKWLTQTFMIDDLLHYYLKYASSFLLGGNVDKIFAIMTGDTNGSKSMNSKLFKATLGQYVASIPVEILTAKGRNPAGPSPHLARLAGVRKVDADEPDDEVSFQKGIIKRLTGGDEFYARLLHDNGRDIKPTFKFVLYVNKVAPIANADAATKGRVVIFPFLSTWVKASEAPITEEEQMKKRKFKIDPTFENKIPSLAPAFLWLMYTYYPIYAQEGIRDLPEIVRLSTEEYWKENDLYIQFTNDKIEASPNSSLTLQEVYEVFKVWYIQSYGSVNIPSRPYFLSMIKVTWGTSPSAEGIWHGISIKEDAGTDNLKGREIAAGSERLTTVDDILQKNLQKYDDGNLSQFYRSTVV